MTLYCKKMETAKPHVAKAPIRDPKTQNRGEEEQALLLPHINFLKFLKTCLPLETVAVFGEVSKKRKMGVNSRPGIL